MEEHSNSTTASATSPPHEDSPEGEGGMLWRALSQNGHSQNTPLTGEASQLLRKLITCRKLGMSITPAPLHPAGLDMQHFRPEPVSVSKPTVQQCGGITKCFFSRRMKLAALKVQAGGNRTFLRRLLYRTILW